MLTVYVLRSQKDGTLYTGMTNDLARRIVEHNRGSNFSTKPHAPFTLIYAEAYVNREDARVREKYLKSGWGRAHVRKVLSNYFRQSKI